MQLDMFPTQIRLQCIDHAKNKRRFYAMQIQPTLFGEWELVREWGRIGRAGRVRHDVYTSEGLALNALSTIKRQKGRRGYVDPSMTSLYKIAGQGEPGYRTVSRSQSKPMCLVDLP